MRVARRRSRSAKRPSGLVRTVRHAQCLLGSPFFTARALALTRFVRVTARARACPSMSNRHPVPAPAPQTLVPPPPIRHVQRGHLCASRRRSTTGRHQLPLRPCTVRRRDPFAYHPVPALALTRFVRVTARARACPSMSNRHPNPKPLLGHGRVRFKSCALQETDGLPAVPFTLSYFSALPQLFERDLCVERRRRVSCV